jgi:uncharacterized protein (DUF1697 family)
VKRWVGWRPARVWRLVPTYVALLRGVNVGGKSKVSMKDLAALFESLGHSEVTTYIQSGNVIFDSRSSLKNASVIESRIADTFGLDVSVVLRTPAELAKVLDRNPFPDADAATLHVTFLAKPPSKAAFARIDASKYAPEEFALGAKEIYLHLPNGMGRSKLAPALVRPAGPEATTRNWRTVTTLLELSQRHTA